MKTSAGLRKIALSVALYACSSGLPAQDLGVVGPVYPITEPDLLATIEQRLETMKENGDLAQIEDDAKARYQAYAERPSGVKLPRATQTRTHYMDPIFIVPRDIKDANGRVLYPAGTRVNPLDYLFFSKKLIFFDGDDHAQVKWAKSLFDSDPVHVKPILVNGPAVAIMKLWGTRLFFDQRGQLVRWFAIESVPAAVSHEGNRLKVVEQGRINSD